MPVLQSERWAVPVLERSIQTPVIAYARKKLGLRCDKLSAGSLYQASGLPDYIIWLRGGRPILIEFKRPGGKPTPLQLTTHKQLKELGYEVYVIDSVEEGKRLLDRLAG